MTTTMIICERCGWEIVHGAWTWKDRMGHETCSDGKSHEPSGRKSR